MSVYSWWTQYFPPKPAFTEKDIPAQNGRVFIVTGASKGVGFELCKILYSTGATIYMTSRSVDHSHTAIQQITTQIPPPPNPGTLHALPLDLSSLPSVRAFASSFASSESRLDVLWHNAGTGPVGIPAGSKTLQDIEAFIGIHCVAPLLLTELLLPLLQKAASNPPQGSDVPQMPRVVWTASHLSDRFAAPGGMDFEVLKKGGHSDGMLDYSASKAGNWLLAHELSLRHPELINVAQNPGNLDTDAFRGIPPFLMAILRYTVLYGAQYGAHTELFAGLSPEVGPEQNGMYIVPWGRIWGDETNTRKDVLKALKKKADGGEEVGRRFWEWCEEQYKNAENK